VVSIFVNGILSRDNELAGVKKSNPVFKKNNFPQEVGHTPLSTQNSFLFWVEGAFGQNKRTLRKKKWNTMGRGIVGVKMMAVYAIINDFFFFRHTQTKTHVFFWGKKPTHLGTGGEADPKPNFAKPQHKKSHGSTRG